MYMRVSFLLDVAVYPRDFRYTYPNEGSVLRGLGWDSSGLFFRAVLLLAKAKVARHGWVQKNEWFIL